MKYILKNKDIDVLEFEAISQSKQGEFKIDVEQNLQNIQLLNKKLLPINFSFELEKGTHLNEALMSWIRHRKAPNNRKYIEKIINTYKQENIPEMATDYIDISLGLSLNDSFWIVPADKDYKWKDFNLYGNEFSEALKLAAFGITSKKLNEISTSPELTTSGMLPKCWHRENGQIYLYKGSSKMNNGADEPCIEFYMAQIADVMGFECVPYDLKEFHGQIVSSCPIFTNENDGYAPMYLCLGENERKYVGVELANAVYKIYDNDKFDDLMVFDALVCNTDRHLGNFGMIIDNNTNKLLRPAPIFDNGLSIMAHIGLDELTQIQEESSKMTGYFNFKFDEQLRLFVQPRHIPNLQKLTEFEFIKHSEFNLGDEWLEPIQAYLQDRAKFALQIAYEKQNKVAPQKSVRKKK